MNGKGRTNIGVFKVTVMLIKAALLNERSVYLVSVLLQWQLGLCGLK